MTIQAMRGEATADVPCDGCTACCTSSQFVHIEPDEHATLARIPNALLFPAPGRPPGHVLLGYDQQGRCPMLTDADGTLVCSIYDDRPRTCRTYDCRVFAAAGLDPRDDDKPAIAERVQEWRFRYADDHARATHDAIRAAARAMVDRRAAGDDTVPPTVTAIAVAAVARTAH